MGILVDTGVWAEEILEKHDKETLAENMVKRALFSVITVVRNAETEIEKTLKSVIGQEYDGFEYVVIDGASTDKTLSIIEQYEEQIDVLVSEPDKGIYNAMNKGIDHAHGEYLIFMNAGDCFASSQVLCKTAQHIEGKDYAFAYGDYIRVSEKGATQVIPSRAIEKMWYGMFASHQSMFYAKTFLEAERLKYDESYKIAADYKLTVETVSRAGKDRCLKLPLCVSRFDLGGISSLNMNLGLKEADRVRKEVMSMGAAKRFGIRLLLLAARILRENEIFRNIYSKLRY